MAQIRGTIERAGEGVQGLRVVAYEEIRVGIELDDETCRMGFPSILQVGLATTDAEGNFTIPFEPREEAQDSCSLSAMVRVSVFDGGVLIWHSPKKHVGPILSFRHEILSEPLPESEPSARFRDTLTLCGRPATGYRVLGFEVTQAGFPTPLELCRRGPESHRHVGTAIVDDQGRFEISYTPTPEPVSACLFSAAVRVEVYDAAVRVWTSPKKPVAPSLRFDNELSPEFAAGSQLVRVVNEFGQRTPGAEVFVNGVFQGTTDDLGQLGVDGLKVGDMLAARLRLFESETERRGHNEGSDRNWNYRVYITNLTLSHDQNGDNPSFELLSVTDPDDVQQLVVRRRNVLVGFNLLVSVEWDATASEMKYYRDRFLETSELIFNATDAQFLIERVTILDRARQWNWADYRIYANLNQSSYATVGGIFGSNGRVRMNPFDAFFPGTLMHEFGHYGFSLSDEYKAAECWPENQPTFCTLAIDTPGTDFSENGTRDACFMRGAQDGSRKKLCSAHPANPHVDCTAQGPEDCWSTVVRQYDGFPDWRLLTPVARGAIVDRLPDSGIPIGTSTNVPSRADEADSYIPVAAWKPHWHMSSVVRPGECPDLVVRTLQGVSPVNGAQVTLLTSDGRSVYQGVTRRKPLPDGTVSGVGEIIIRGAHVGESIQVVLPFGASSLQKTVVIQSCASPLVVTLPEVAAPAFAARWRSLGVDHVELTVAAGDLKAVPPPTIAILADGEEEPFVLEPAFEPGRPDHGLLLPTATGDQDIDIVVTGFDEYGNRAIVRSRVATRRMLVDAERTVRSAGGDMELVIPRGALETPVQLIIEDAQGLPLPELGESDVLLVPPHRISSSGGASLLRPALLHIHAGGEFETDPYGDLVELLEYVKPKDIWRRLPARINEFPLVASASIETLGVFALVRRVDC